MNLCKYSVETIIIHLYSVEYIRQHRVLCKDILRRVLDFGIEQSLLLRGNLFIHLMACFIGDVLSRKALTRKTLGGRIRVVVQFDKNIRLKVFRVHVCDFWGSIGDE